MSPVTAACGVHCRFSALRDSDAIGETHSAVPEQDLLVIEPAAVT